MFHQGWAVLQTSLPGGCNFLSTWSDHLFSEVFQGPNIFESFTPALESGWNWPVTNTDGNTHGQWWNKVLSLKIQPKTQPSEVHCYGLYCSIKPHNFNIWRQEAKFRRVTISILISWKWLRVWCWILHSSLPSFSHSGVLLQWRVRLLCACKSLFSLIGWGTFIMVIKTKSETGAWCSVGDLMCQGPDLWLHIFQLKLFRWGLYSLQITSMGNGEGGSRPPFACGSALALAGRKLD